MADTKLAITQTRSTCGRPKRQRRTLRALGFRKHQQTVIHEDNPQVRGMIARVEHLVDWHEVEEDA